MANNAATPESRPVLLITRPAVSAARFITQLDVSVVSHADLIVSPLLEIVPTGAKVELSGVSAVIFTSANGVANGPDGTGLPAHCVGLETAKAAAGRGWAVKTTGLHADDLVERLAGTYHGTMLHLCGSYHRGEIAERLSAAGNPTTRTAVYKQCAMSLNNEAKQALSGERHVVVPLFSPRSAVYFSKEASDASRVHCIALSEAVAEALGAMQFESLQVLEQPTGQLMLQAVESQLSRLKL